MQNYRVQLETYAGPMDLLLYLIRREEVDIYDIPIAGILEQYLGYVRMLEQLDPEAVGEFLVLAATLMEIKSRLLLPKPPPEVEDDDGLDPRADLVRQLLAYRAYRDAAGRLHERADQHQRRYARPPVDMPDDGTEEVDLEEVQIWDLLTAFNKLLASVGQRRVTHDVMYDDTPISLHADDILDRLVREGPSLPFERVFEGRTRSEMVGLFLALLELMRQQRVRVQQDDVFSTIHVHLLDSTPITSILAAEDASEPEPESQIDGEPEDPEFAELREDDGLQPHRIEPPLHLDDEHDAYDDESDDEDDEFSRRLNEVEIGEVDLGRKANGDDDEQEENA